MFNRERFAQPCEHFKAARRRLEEARAQPESELVRDAVIQRFEFTYESA